MATDTDKTSKVKTDKHDTYCSVCRVWYPKAEKACPGCGRGLLMG